MRIIILIQNTNTGETEFEQTAPDVDSAISELGRLERIIKDGYSCPQCGEPSSEARYCNELCVDLAREELPF